MFLNRGPSDPQRVMDSLDGPMEGKGGTQLEGGVINPGGNDIFSV